MYTRHDASTAWRGVMLTHDNPMWNAFNYLNDRPPGCDRPHGISSPDVPHRGAEVLSPAASTSGHRRDPVIFIAAHTLAAMANERATVQFLFCHGPR
ncbi:MAG: hypothetical protein H6522_11190 [Mycolicibacterium sp.]|nr:hypothetical protein [Mycolicibacterium sp.]